MMLAGRSETNENQNQVLFWKRDFIITESENMASTAAVALSVPLSPYHSYAQSLSLSTSVSFSVSVFFYVSLFLYVCLFLSLSE